MLRNQNLLKIWEAQIFQPRLPGVLDARAVRCWCCYAALRSSYLKIVMADVKMKFVENILELIISELIHEDIEKIGDAGKEDGREALGKVVDKIDIIVNVICLENLRLNRDESIESFVHFSTETRFQPAPHRIHFLMLFLVEEEEKCKVEYIF